MHLACHKECTQLNFYPINGLFDEKKGWHTYIYNAYHGACILHTACNASHMHAEGWTECILPSTLLEIDFLIPYGLLLVLILEEIKQG